MALLNRIYGDNPPGNTPSYMTKSFWSGIGKKIVGDLGINTDIPAETVETPVPLPTSKRAAGGAFVTPTTSGVNTLVSKPAMTTMGSTAFAPTDTQGYRPQTVGTTQPAQASGPPATRTPIPDLNTDLEAIPPPTSISAGNLEQLKREGIAKSKYESLYQPEKSQSLSALEQYRNMVDKAVRTGGLVDAASAFYNMGIAQRELNRIPSDKLEAPIVRAPRLLSPAQAVKTATTEEIKRTYSGARQLLSESGRGDLIVGLTADEVAARSDVAAQAAITDYDVINKNIAAETEALNLSDSIRMDVDFKNMQMQIQENMMSGQIISEAVASLGDTARQFINRMTEAEYDKWVADLLTRERNMQFLG